MNEKKALQTILISLYCILPNLDCKKCPHYENDHECTSIVTDDMLNEAISIVESMIGKLSD